MVLLIALAAGATVFGSQVSAAAAASTDLRSAIAPPSFAPASALNLTGEWSVTFHCEFGCQSSEPCENNECLRIVPFYQEEGADLLENLFDHDTYATPGSNYPYSCSEPAPNEGGPLRALCGIATGNSFEYKECLNSNVPPEKCGSLWLEESGTVSANGLSWTGTVKVGTGKYGGTPIEGGTTTATRITGAEPALSITRTTVAEPTSGTGTASFPVTLSAPSTSQVSVEYATKNGSGGAAATAPGDYAATRGTLTFNPGETSKTIPVTVNANGFKGKRMFSVVLSNPQGANISTGEATGTIVGPSPLRVTITIPSPEVNIQQNEAGPIPQNITATVTVKNAGKLPIENVTLPANLTLGWHGQAPINALPIKQVGIPAKLRLGTIAPGASSKRSEYTIQVSGDGHFEVQALVTGSEGNEPVHALGTSRTIEPTSQLLFFSAKRAQSTVSPMSSQLLLAGTPFTMRVHMENRSYYRPLLVSPLVAKISGNVIGGKLQPVGRPLPASGPPEGSLAETDPNPIVRLEPRQSVEYELVFSSSASNAWEDGQAAKKQSGGTRGTVEIQAPEIGTVEEGEATTGEPEKITPQPASDEVIDPATLEQQIYGFDDSAPVAGSTDAISKILGYSNGLFQFAWHATTGLLHGVFIDLPVGIVTALPTFTFKYIELETTLWKDIEGNPALKSLYFNALTNEVLLIYVEAPKLAPKFAQAYEQVSNAVGAHLTEEAKQWYAGDWQKAVGDLSAEGGSGAGSIASIFVGPAALAKGVALAQSGGVLMRLAPVIEAATSIADAEKATAEADFFASSAAKEEEAAEAAAKAGKVSNATPAQRAARVQSMVDLLEDGKIPPGIVLDPANPEDLELIAQAYGIPPEEAVKLATYAKEKGLTMVARSRGIGTPERIAEGAYLKGPPFYAKNASPLDVSLFGWDQSKVHDLVTVDLKLPYGNKPLPQALADFASELPGKGYEPGTASYDAALNRYKVQWKGLNEELPTWRVWAKQAFENRHGQEVEGYVDMKWDATENPIDFGARPGFNPKRISKVRFRLHREGRYVFPQLKPLPSDPWGSITGDVDWLSFGDSEGLPLQGANAVDLLNDLGYFAAQHPQSESWVKNGLFEFDQKLEYLSGYNSIQELDAAGGIGKQTNLQFCPDGMIRTVVLDFNTSSFKSPTDYLVRWKGGWVSERG